MRLLSLASTALALVAGALSLTAESNLTEPRSTQKIITGDFKPPQVFENTNLVRNINLEKGYVRETTNILVTNTDKSPQSEYYIPFEYDVMGRIGGFDARDKKNPDYALDVSIAALEGILDDQDGESKYERHFMLKVGNLD
jgi:oligosaccharyltransferase complex subunit alpha (ribophorin I)